MSDKLDPRSLPRGKVRDGNERDDAKEGQWSRLERERMDQQFHEAMGSALQNRGTDSAKRR